MASKDKKEVSESAVPSTADRQILYNFWKNVQTIQFKDATLYKFADQEVRNAILEILREGIDEENLSTSKKMVRRHALNAQELQIHVNKRIDTPVKLSNVYFHLRLGQQ